MSGRLPDGACDAHCQVFGPAAEFSYAVPNPPADAPKAAMFEKHGALGFDRGVLVQPTCHGGDNAAMLDAIAAGGGRYRGVAVVPEAVTAEEIATLHQAGVRAIRLNFVPQIGPSPSRSTILRWQQLIGVHGWSFVAHVPAADLPSLSDDLAAIDLEMAIDHVGRINASNGGIEQEPFQRLLAFARRPNIWVKLSATDRISVAGPPYDDLVPFIAELASVQPDRLLWGSNWPHPNLKTAPPDEEPLLETLSGALGGEALLKAVLVDNPERLYFKY